MKVVDVVKTKVETVTVTFNSDELLLIIALLGMTTQNMCEDFNVPDNTGKSLFDELGGIMGIPPVPDNFFKYKIVPTGKK